MQMVCNVQRDAGAVKRGIAVTILIALVMATSINLRPAVADTVRIHGSTTFNRAMLEPFQKEIEQLSTHRLKIVPNKSANGIVDLLEGRADMAMISASMVAVVAKVKILRPKLNTDTLISHSIAETQVAFVVHPSNTIKRMALVDLVKILTGETKNWKELGGPDLPILTAYVRRKGGVTYAVQHNVLKGRAMSPSMPAAMESPIQVAEIVSQERSAIGLAQLQLAEEYRLGQLSLKKKVVQHLNLVTLGKPKPAMEAVIRAARAIAKTDSR